MANLLLKRESVCFLETLKFNLPSSAGRPKNLRILNYHLRYARDVMHQCKKTTLKTKP